jgi:hypothetical protein
MHGSGDAVMLCMAYYTDRPPGSALLPRASCLMPPACGGGAWTADNLSPTRTESTLNPALSPGWRPRSRPIQTMPVLDTLPILSFSLLRRRTAGDQQCAAGRARRRPIHAWGGTLGRSVELPWPPKAAPAWVAGIPERSRGIASVGVGAGGGRVEQQTRPVSYFLFLSCQLQLQLFTIAWAVALPQGIPLGHGARRALLAGMVVLLALAQASRRNGLCLVSSPATVLLLAARLPWVT